MEIKQVFILFKRWLWLLILVSLIAGAAGYYISSRQPPMYQASTRFVILRPATTSYDYYSYVDSQQLFSTYVQLLSTEALLDQVSRELGFQVLPGQASASQISDTQFVRLTVTDGNPKKAAAIANALVSILIEQNEELQSVRFETTEQNLQQRADSAIEQVELLKGQIATMSDEILQEQLANVETQIDELQPQVADLQRKVASVNPLIASDEEVTQSLIDQAELDQLKSVLSLYQEIYTELIVMEEPRTQGETATSQQAQLQRTLNLYEQIYFNSISSLEALNLTRVQSIPNVVQVELAYPPSSPISPRPQQDAMLYAAVGLLGSAGIAFLVEYMDDTIKTAEDVEKNLGLPVLGYVAEIKNKGNNGSEQKSGMAVAVQPRSPVSESFRSLRTSLEFYNVDTALKSLIVTSPTEKVGKTTVSTNLAIVFAQNNKRVVLLDADLRRPNVHKQLSITNRIGLSDLLRGRLVLDDVIQVSETIPNFHVITSGSLPPNPADLLGSVCMTKILEDLKSEFDWIIIDTPPGIVTDAQILSTKADGVIYVIQPGKTRKTSASKPLEEFRRVNANLLGVVMNRIPRNREYYYGGYNYYSQAYSESDYYHFEEDSDRSDKLSMSKRDCDKE